MTRKQIEDYFELLLETEDLEDILERYNITPIDALMELFDNGLIDEPYGERYTDDEE